MSAAKERLPEAVEQARQELANSSSRMKGGSRPMKLTKKQRCELHAKFAGHCAYCGVLLGDRWHADHMEAVSARTREVDGKYSGAIILGRPENHAINNMMPACVPCNLSKAAMPLRGLARAHCWTRQLPQQLPPHIPPGQVLWADRSDRQASRFPFRNSGATVPFHS